MAIVFYRQFSAVITPNKCASSTVEASCKKYQITNSIQSYNVARRILSRPEVTVYCTTRNPVDYFVSGYRYLKETKGAGAYVPIKKDFLSHLEMCREQKEIQSHQWISLIPPYFASHAWWGPHRTIKQELLYQGNVEWVKLEQPHAVETLIKQIWNIDIPQHKVRINTTDRSRYVRRPLTDREVELIAELEDWSHLCGYDVYECADNFNRKLNTV